MTRFPTSVDEALHWFRRGYMSGEAQKLQSTRKRAERKEMLSGLPDLDENLQPIRPDTLSIMKQAWSSQTLLNEWHNDAPPYMMWLTDPEKYREEIAAQREQAAWNDAVRWIKAKHAPDPVVETIIITWDWPNPKVSQSPKPLGVGDLEEDWEDDDYDD